MKKSLLVLVLLAAFCQVKAQQLFPVKPADSLKNLPFEKYFNINPNSRQQLPQWNVNPLQKLASVSAPVKVSSYDYMPIALLQGSSKMPVVKLGGNYKMPMAKLGGPDVIVLDPKKVTP